MRRKLIKGCLVVALIVVLLAIAAIGFIWFQAARTPTGKPEYVALGSSFAAGAGLGQSQAGSPLLCARSVNSYPQRLARMRKLAIVDMSCGGAVTRHLLDGGQFLHGAQIRTITPETRIVTITVGGNDTLYIGDLSQLAARNSGSMWGWLVRHLWPGPKSWSERNFAGFERELTALIKAIQGRAPAARIIVATYPTILPPSGTCDRLGLTELEAAMMRRVGDQLAASSRAAAQRTGAGFVDMHSLGAQHNACSNAPWTYGWYNAGLAPFHPTKEGAKATAEAISKALDHQQL